jgi:hypothetical protein
MRVLPLLMCACLAPRSPRPDDVDLPPDVVPTPPDIVQINDACDPDTGVWSLFVRTSGWVGQARTWWTVDGLYVEQHPMASVAYAPDGTADELFLQLPIAPDVSLAEEGRATALSCGANPSIRIVVTPPEGPVQDCYDLVGAFEDWDQVAGLPNCPE